MGLPIGFWPQLAFVSMRRMAKLACRRRRGFPHLAPCPPPSARVSARVVPLNVVGRDQSASCSALTGGGFSAAPGESRFRTAVAGLVVGLRFTPLGARCRSRLIVAVMPIVAFQGILGLQDLVRRPGAGSCRSPCRSRVDTSFYDIGGSHRSGVLAPGLAEDAARVSPFEPWGLSRSDKPRVLELSAVV